MLTAQSSLWVYGHFIDRQTCLFSGEHGEQNILEFHLSHMLRCVVQRKMSGFGNIYGIQSGIHLQRKNQIHLFSHKQFKMWPRSLQLQSSVLPWKAWKEARSLFQHISAVLTRLASEFMWKVGNRAVGNGWGMGKLFCPQLLREVTVEASLLFFFVPFLSRNDWSQLSKILLQGNQRGMRSTTMVAASCLSAANAELVHVQLCIISLSSYRLIYGCILEDMRLD